MGLQITAHNRLELVDDSKKLEQEYFENSNSRVITLFDNPEFPYHIGSLKGHTLYRVKGQTFSFRSGNTRSFKVWKEWLAKVGGFENLADVWKTKDYGPFVELLNFSDSEGTIGPAISRKLSQDFNDYESNAILLKDELAYGYDFYKNWKKAFNIAARDNGVVIFK